MAALTAQGKKGLLPYITAGYPDLATTAALLRRFDRLGVTAVELGVPFSDSIADGPVIQESFYRALDAGFTVDRLMATIQQVRADVTTPIITMVSFSIVRRIGVAGYLAKAAQAGVDGLIIPDLSLEEAPDIAQQAGQAGLRLVMLVAPTSPIHRREQIARVSTGFIYYMSVAGITGERSQLPPEVVANVAALRTASGKPVVVGFGIGKPEHVATVCQTADGAIVGSAIVRKIGEAIDRKLDAEGTADMVGGFVEALMSPLK